MTEERGGLLFQHQILRGGIVNNEKVALEIVRALVDDAWGPGTFEKQKPIAIRDNGDVWVIEGSNSNMGRAEWEGPIRIVIRKANSEVLQFDKVGYMLP